MLQWMWGDCGQLGGEGGSLAPDLSLGKGPSPLALWPERGVTDLAVSHPNQGSAREARAALVPTVSLNLESG